MKLSTIIILILLALFLYPILMPSEDSSTSTTSSSSIIDKGKNTISNIVSEDKTEEDDCELWAETIIPEFVFTWNDFWNNEEPLGEYKNIQILEDCFSKGSKTGENVNLYYWSNICSEPSYNKKSIDPQGNILGENTVNLTSLVLRRIDSKPTIEYEWGDFVETSRSLYVSWNNIVPEFIEIYEPTIEIETNPNYKYPIRKSCSIDVDKPSGEYECKEHKNYGGVDVNLKPFEFNKYYEIVDFKIGSCNHIGQNINIQYETPLLTCYDFCKDRNGIKKEADNPEGGVLCQCNDGYFTKLDA